jgi:hypothetical protein
MKNPIRREPVQLVFWTPRQLHLMQPGRQAAADRQYQRSLRARTESRPIMDPYWVADAYRAFWDGKEWGSGPPAGEDDGGGV